VVASHSKTSAIIEEMNVATIVGSPPCSCGCGCFYVIKIAHCD